MGILAVVCFVILLLIIPNEIWAALFYLALVALVCFVGFWALVIWMASLS